MKIIIYFQFHVVLLQEPQHHQHRLLLLLLERGGRADGEETLQVRSGVTSQVVWIIFTSRMMSNINFEDQQKITGSKRAKKSPITPGISSRVGSIAKLSNI